MSYICVAAKNAPVRNKSTHCLSTHFDLMIHVTLSNATPMNYRLLINLDRGSASQVRVSIDRTLLSCSEMFHYMQLLQHAKICSYLLYRFIFA